ncbi:MAG TPA: hypothetical protein VKS21_13210 [Spirochaetota bacterium]|nr:hypothetical protein [Spirochaetota bacterium]
MKSKKRVVLLWAVLLLLTGVDSASCALPFFFNRVDYIFASAAILFMFDKKYTAFIYAFAAFLIKDLVLMPFPGLYLLSGTAGLMAVAALCRGLYKENYITKIFILAGGEAALWAAHIAAVVIFYWGMEIRFFTPVFLLNIIFTVFAGAVVMKLIHLDARKVRLWLRMTFGKK